jgi:hypothetical protein
VEPCGELKPKGRTSRAKIALKNRGHSVSPCRVIHPVAASVADCAASAATGVAVGLSHLPAHLTKLNAHLHVIGMSVQQFGERKRCLAVYVMADVAHRERERRVDEGFQSSQPSSKARVGEQICQSAVAVPSSTIATDGASKQSIAGPKLALALALTAGADGSASSCEITRMESGPSTPLLLGSLGCAARRNGIMPATKTAIDW